MFFTDTLTRQYWPCAVLLSGASPTCATPQVTLLTTNSNLPSRTGWFMPAFAAGAAPPPLDGELVVGLLLLPDTAKAITPPIQHRARTPPMMPRMRPVLPRF